MKMTQTGDSQYRFTLTRDWGTGQGRVCWIMLNPSTADGTKDDPTLKRIIKFSQSWGYRELVVVNLYPFRTSKPAECRKLANYEANGPDWYARDAIQQNWFIVQREAKASDLVMAAWGAAGFAWDSANEVIELVQTYEAPYPHLHTLVKDRPIHPLARGLHRVPDSATPVLWREGSR